MLRYAIISLDIAYIHIAAMLLYYLLIMMAMDYCYAYAR
jgi:hypothetical protein